MTQIQAVDPPDGWVVVWAVFAGLALIFGVAYSFAAFFASFAQEYAAQRADVSLVFGLTGFTYFTLGAAAGILADRFGPRLVCSLGMVAIAAGLLATSFAGSLMAIYLSYGVGIGMGIALVYTPSIACVLPWFTARRGLASGIASSGIGAGTLLLPLLASYLITTLDWRSALRLMALGVLVLGLAAMHFLKKPAGQPRAAGQAAAQLPEFPGATLQQALHDVRFWWFYAFTLFAGPVMFIPFAHVSASARDFGLSEAQAVGLVGLIGIGSLVGRFAITALADRFGRMATLTVMQVSMGASYLLWGSGAAYPALALFALWFGLSYGSIVSLMPAICMDLFGGRAVASIVGVLYSAAALGNLLGPVIAGAVFDRMGSYTPVIAACLVFSALSTIAMGLMIKANRVANHLATARQAA